MTSEEIKTKQFDCDYIEQHYEEFKPFINAVCIYQKLTEKFIEDHVSDIDWNLISSYQNVSLEFLKRHKNQVNWDLIHEARELDWDYTIKLFDSFEHKCDFWFEEGRFDQTVTAHFVERYLFRFHWNWDNISSHVRLPEWFLEKYKNKVNWDLIFKYQDFTEEWIDKHIDKFNFDDYVLTHRVSEDWIRKYNKHIGNYAFGEMMLTQKLSETFVREFIHRIGSKVTKRENSIDFIREAGELIDMGSTHFRPKFTMKQIEEFKDRLDWDWVSQCQKFDENFAEKWSERVTWRELEQYHNFTTEFITRNWYRLKPDC